MKQILMGNDAIALGLIHAGVDMISGYPGTPSSEILGNFQKYNTKFKLNAYAQWATNEKVGFEVAYAGAISGKRTCATMKQVGLNVASDALMSASYLGLKGAMLLVSCDDPGFYSSQTEQDSRSFAKFARIPVLDPATPQEAYDMVKLGLNISHLFESVVMLRPVMRVSHAREICEVDDALHVEAAIGHFERNIPRWAAVPPAGRFRQGREQLERIEYIKEWNWINLIEPKIKSLYKNNILCLTSGTGDGYVRETLDELHLDADVLKLDMPYPLPKEKIENLFATYDKVIIFEESYPCIEEQLSSPKLYGKLTKHAHEIDEFSKDKVVDTFVKVGVIEPRNTYKNEKYTEELPKRPPNMCPGCPHRDVHYAITKVFKKKTSIYASDIGCYTLGLNQGAIDILLCMGGSIALASGFSISDPDKAVVATIGDSTFTHSGVAPLINAVSQNHKFVLVILDNSTTAMTGRQTTPERTNPAQVDIKRIVEGCGIECFEYVYEQDLNKTVNFIKSLKKVYETANAPVVAVVREFCVLDKELVEGRLGNAIVSVDEEKCVACDSCITTYKCPPMHYNDAGKMEIDPFLCAGCSSCLDVVCPTDAFIKK
ncbi:MAG: thiamine pyrophosphate-dependent enzyme [Sulfurospirillaceae bacterium]|nr:thiamine pyrophosphate-dependent enzyme [Sulfurospirillaceae bacterium]MDD2826217.1 thiamine pyrophosphate-dependent enzyme [Sulfurospirillaceae bacterium]